MPWRSPPAATSAKAFAERPRIFIPTSGRDYNRADDERSGSMRSVFLGIFLISAVSAAGQTPKPKVPRAPDGHPDLQGTWDFAQLTPFERPSALAGKSSFSDEEAEEFAQQRIETGNKDDRERRRRGRRRARLQRLLVGLRQARREADVAGRRSGRRPRAGADAGRAGAQRGAARQVRQPGRASARRALRGRFQLGAADDPERVQQQHAAGADARHRADPQRDDPQRAPRRAERAAAPAGARSDR